MVGGTGGRVAPRPRAARVRPNWWVMLAVSLALMALLVATAGGSPHRPMQTSDRAAGTVTTGHLRPATSPGTHERTTTTTSGPPHRAPQASTPLSQTAGPGTALTSPHLATSSAPATSTPPTTATSAPLAPQTTTTTAAPTAAAPTAAAPANVAQTSDRTQSEGYLDPPVQTSTGFGFTGSGAMTVSVVWSGSTYLSMTVSCANGAQTVGGTSAMEASLPDATGACRATVSEPASESAAVTFTISIGPAGG